MKGQCEQSTESKDLTYQMRKFSVVDDDDDSVEGEERFARLDSCGRCR